MGDGQLAQDVGMGDGGMGFAPSVEEQLSRLVWGECGADSWEWGDRWPGIWGRRSRPFSRRFGSFRYEGGG